MTPHMSPADGENVPPPVLNYRWLRRDGDGVHGDGPALRNVMEVDAWEHKGRIIVTARGQMLCKDGTPSRVHRSVEVDYIRRGQPDWLTAIVEDAHRRLGVDRG